MLVKDYNYILNGYINDNDARYAVLVNGKWGSGKTYYIKNYLNFELNEDKYIKVYVSLYGMEKIEDINIYIINAYLKMLFGMISDNELNIEKYCRICNKFYLTYDIKKTKYIYNNIVQYITNQNIYEIIKWLMNQMKFEFMGYNFDFLKNMIDRKLKEVVAESKVLLVIDDFERSNLGFVNVLGYINNLVEHYKYKVILVANEEYINICYANKDINLKVAGLLSGKFVNEKFERKELYSIITNKLNYDIEYYSIKEKTIGKTLNFELNIHEIIIEIMKNYIKSIDDKRYAVEFEKFIVKNIDVIINVFQILKNKNCRNIYNIIKSNFLIFDTLYRCIRNKFATDIDVYNYTNDLLIKIMKKITFMTIEANEEYKRKNEYIVDEKSIKNNNPIKFNIFSYSVGENYDEVIEELLDNYILNESELEKVFVDNYKSYIKNKNLTIYKINSFEKIMALKSDFNIVNHIKNLKKELTDDLYDIKQYTLIINILLRIIVEYKINIGDDFDDILKIMLLKIQDYKKNNVNLNFDFREDYYLSLKNVLSAERFEMLKKIYNELEINEEEYIEYHLGTMFIDDNCDMEKLVLFVKENHDKFLLAKEFAKFIDIDIFTKIIKNGKLEDIYKLHKCFIMVYDFGNVYEFFRNDLNKLKEFQNIIQLSIRDDKNDNLKKYILNSFNEYIISVINELKR